LQLKIKCYDVRGISQWTLSFDSLLHLDENFLEYASKLCFLLFLQLGWGEYKTISMVQSPEKTLLPLGFDAWTVQPIASLYTDYAIPAYDTIWYGGLPHNTVDHW